MTPSRKAVAARGAGAALLAAGVGLALRRGGVGLAVVAPASAGVIILALWRTVAGAVAGFAVLVVAAVFARHGAPLPAPMRPLLQPFVVVELFGWVTILAVALARDPRRISRRLLTTWLASSGALLVGAALCVSEPTARAGSALVAAALAYRVGTVPAYAWAPLLLRHPARHIAMLGASAALISLGLLAVTVPVLPAPGVAIATVDLLAGVTLPWALWHVVRQWPVDRRCALTYLVVFVVALLLVGSAAWRSWPRG